MQALLKNGHGINGIKILDTFLYRPWNVYIRKKMIEGMAIDESQSKFGHVLSFYSD